MIVNLLKERDSQIIGTIGEILAWGYLSKKGISIRLFGQSPVGIFGIPVIDSLQAIRDLGLDERRTAYLETFEKNSLVRPPGPSELSMERPNPNDPDYEEKWARYCEEYREFLRKQGWTGEERWDFVGVGYGSRNKPPPVYVIEVKTTRPGSRRQRSISALKPKLPGDPDRAKEAGFTPLLIVVHLLDSWKFEVIELSW